VFFVDPQITKDPDTKGIDEITLSYTFYPTGN
jgi:cytochrome c oxidase assembly protein subunit 11